MELLGEQGKLLGYLPSINTPVFSRAPALDPSSGAAGAESPVILAVYSYCLSWKGMYRPVGEPDSSTKLTSVSWRQRNVVYILSFVLLSGCFCCGCHGTNPAVVLLVLSHHNMLAVHSYCLSWKGIYRPVG
jgi:hypothetical protein